MVFTTFGSSQIGAFSNTFIGIGRNRMINGDCQIDQRYAYTAHAVTVAGDPICDMWKVDSNGGGTLTCQVLSATPPTGFLKYLRTTVTVNDATPAAADRYSILTRFEGNVVADFMMGTANAKTVTLSFWVRSSLTGTFGTGMDNPSATRSWVGQYTINAANTWEYKTITFTLDTTGTWPTDNTIAMSLRWDMGSGANYEGVTGWQNGALLQHVSGNTQLIVTSSATWDITGVQLEIGSSATPFEYTSYAQQLTRCQRYFETSYLPGVLPGTALAANPIQIVAVNINSAMESSSIFYKVPKRILPTLIIYNYSTGASASARWFSTAGAESTRVTSVDAATTNSFAVFQSVSTSDVAAYVHFTSDASM